LNLVRNTGRQFTQTGHLFGLNELGLCGSQLSQRVLHFFFLFPQRDICLLPDAIVAV
jgi:hypothetical protein